MAEITQNIRRNSRVKLTFVLTERRNESTFGDVIDITGYAFRLIAKEFFADTDAEAFIDLAGVLEDATNGVYSFQLTTAHTSFKPGTYPAEIIWWDDGVTTKRPTDAISIDLTIEDQVDQEI